MTLLLLLVASPAIAETSQLWGEAGERFEPAGRLPDVSWAGVGQGEVEIPSPAVVTTVLKT